MSPTDDRAPVEGAADGGLELRQFKASYESFGILVDYLARTPPFQNFRLKDLIPALKHQLASGHHVCAFREDRLVGYCGWLLVTVAMGEKWRSGSGDLKPVADAQADAAALTIVRADAPESVLPMIRAARTLNKGRRVFFRRDYEQGARQKRQTVLNR